jgi:hypothetical protein
MEEFGWQLRVNGILTYGIFLINGKVPCAPSHGFPRGTPLLAVRLFIKILWRLWDSNPGPPHHIAPSQSLSDKWTTSCALLCIQVILYLNLHFVLNDGGSGWGLAPIRSFIVLT